jgi:histidine triad (HIT) family protein
MSDCIFCEIIKGNAQATIVADYGTSLVIVPLDPVVEGHLLVISKEHVEDFAEDWEISGQTMGDAALHIQLTNPEKDYNIITSKGKAATQSVFHLHLHIVPREENDGLALPWYSGKKRKVPIQGSGYTSAQLLGGH